MGVAPGAVVHWQIPRTLGGTIHRLTNYSHYGLEAGLGHTWHYRTFFYDSVALSLALLGLLHSAWSFALLFILFAVRVVKTILCNEKEKRGLLAYTMPRLLLVGVILVAADLATLWGALRWLRTWLSARSSGKPGVQ